MNYRNLLHQDDHIQCGIPGHATDAIAKCPSRTSAAAVNGEPGHDRRIIRPTDMTEHTGRRSARLSLVSTTEAPLYSNRARFLVPNSAPDVHPQLHHAGGLWWCRGAVESGAIESGTPGAVRRASAVDIYLWDWKRKVLRSYYLFSWQIKVRNATTYFFHWNNIKRKIHETPVPHFSPHHPGRYRYKPPVSPDGSTDGSKGPILVTY